MTPSGVTLSASSKYSNVYALAEWHEEYSTSAKEFLAVYVPRLLQMAGGTQGLDDVRIVFFPQGDPGVPHHTIRRARNGARK